MRNTFCSFVPNWIQQEYKPHGVVSLVGVGPAISPGAEGFSGVGGCLLGYLKRWRAVGLGREQEGELPMIEIKVQ